LNPVQPLDFQPPRIYLLNMFKTSLILAGLAQLAIAMTSLLIPRLLDWPKETRLLSPLTRRVFWTYAGYILGTNLWFAALAIGWPSQLASGTPLAALVTGFIAAYWLVRIIIQFAWFRRSLSDDRRLFKVAEVVYVAGFAYVTVVFAAATLHNVGMLVR
jgi:hypothetical protein